jgi:hypothetical protein
MKAATPTLQAFLANPPKLAWRAELYTVTLASGAIYRWTTCDVGLTVNGQTWLANGAVLRRGNTRQTAKLEIDSVDVVLNGAFPLSVTGYVQATIASLVAAGAFDYSRVQVDQIVGASPGDRSTGLVQAWFEGRWAGSDTHGATVTLKVESEFAALNVMLPRFPMGPGCSNAVYDANCQVAKVTDTDAAALVTGSGSIASNAVAIRSRPSGYYNLGIVLFNADGTRRAIKSFTSNGVTGTFVLYLPLPPGDDSGTKDIGAYPGCPRTMAACSAFPNGLGAVNNLVNFRGFPYVPRPETNR